MPRIYQPCFVRSPEGLIYCIRGDRNVQKWDGLLAAFADAGVPAPSAALTLGASTSGTIVGRIYAYTRFIDVDGQVSNLSPVSAVLSIAVTTGSITAATNAGPIVITSAAHGLTNGQTVKIEGVIGNYAANGTWLVANKTTDTFELAGSLGSGTFITSGTWSKGAGQIDYTSVPTTSDTRVVSKQILRSKDGDATVFYVDVDSTSLATTSFTSTKTEDQLTDAVALIDTDGRDLNISTHAEPPNWKRFGAHFRGRLWMAGQLTYREGGVVLTNGSATVTGLQTAWTSAMVGWEFFPLGASNTVSYTVSTVNTSAQTLTLDAVYAGTTDPYSSYAMTPPVLNTAGGSEARSLYFSSAGIPESFSLSRSLTLEETNQGDITALIPYQNNLYVGCERALYRIVYSSRPESDAQVRGVIRRGVVNNNCWRIVDDTVFCMDRRGIYAFTEGESKEISEPIRGLFDGTCTTRINWRNTEFFHAVDYPNQGIIKWFVVLSGGKYPRHAICFSTRTNRWWIEEYSVPVTASTVATINGTQTVLIAIPSRSVGASIESSADGVPGDTTCTLRGTATSGGRLTLTDTAAAFTSDVVGSPLNIVEGTGSGQQRTIISATSTVLTVDQRWKVKPDSTSVYQVGGVQWRWRSGSLRWSIAENEKRQSSEIIWGTTVNTHAMSIERYISRSATPETFSADWSGNAVRTVNGSSEAWITTTAEGGFARQEYADISLDKIHGRETVQIEVGGVTNNESLSIYELTTEGADR